MTPCVAPGIHVIAHDRLNANHVLLKGRDECVVIDTGYRLPHVRSRSFSASQPASREAITDELLRSGAIVECDGMLVPALR